VNPFSPCPFFVDEMVLASISRLACPPCPMLSTRQPHLVKVLEPEFGRLWVVHRLDRITSGVIVLARTAAAHRALNIQFETRQTAKLYHALVVGAPAWDEYTADLPLRADGIDVTARSWIMSGKRAVTHCRVLERFPPAHSWRRDLKPAARTRFAPTSPPCAIRLSPMSSMGTAGRSHAIPTR